MEKLNVDIEALQSLHRFGDALENAIQRIQSETLMFEGIRDARDCIGKHWYGMRCRVTEKNSGIPLYLHIGLIYYPTTRYGLMVELDEQNNPWLYDTVLKHIKKRNTFEINRDEAKYFKLFMPDRKFEEMCDADSKKQIEILGDFVKSAGEAMMEAAVVKGFSINYKQMADARNLCDAFDRVLREARGSKSEVAVNYEDKDNFGQYASGFRYYLSNYEKQVSMYAYFGMIYSYKKQPSGIFAEIDKFSNESIFDQVEEQMTEGKSYWLSKKEPGFIKLFMTETVTQQLNEADYDMQIEILKAFLEECNDNLISAWEKGVK